MGKVKMLVKKARLGTELAFLKFMQRVNYKYFKKHFPYYIKRMGVKFSGDINKTGFIATDVRFDSLAYAHMIELGEETIISGGVHILVHDYSIATAIRSVRPVTELKNCEASAPRCSLQVSRERSL